MQLPETMRAEVLTGHGGLDKLGYHEDWPTPTPAAGEVDVHAEATRRQYRRRNMKITRIRVYRKSLPPRSRQLHLGSRQRDNRGQLDHRGGRCRYRPLRLFTSAISGFRVEPDYDSIGDPVAVYA